LAPKLNPQYGQSRHLIGGRLKIVNFFFNSKNYSMSATTAYTSIPKFCIKWTHDAKVMNKKPPFQGQAGTRNELTKNILSKKTYALGTTINCSMHNQ